jgi:hypothetical protein
VPVGSAQPVGGGETVVADAPLERIPVALGRSRPLGRLVLPQTRCEKPVIGGRDAQRRVPIRD